MSSVPFHYVDLRAFCYVTEDEQRVADALGLLLPEDHDLDRAESEGHYGDRILVLSTRVENAAGMRAVLDSLQQLPAEDRERLTAEFEDRIDENCSLFVTLDKQAAYRGEVQLGDGITLRGKVEAYPAKREHAIEALESAEVL